MRGSEPEGGSFLSNMWVPNLRTTNPVDHPANLEGAIASPDAAVEGLSFKGRPRLNGGAFDLMPAGARGNDVKTPKSNKEDHE